MLRSIPFNSIVLQATKVQMDAQNTGPRIFYLFVIESKASNYIINQRGRHTHTGKCVAGVLRTNIQLNAKLKQKQRSEMVKTK